MANRIISATTIPAIPIGTQEIYNQNNVILVGPGTDMDYSDIQSAIDAASANDCIKIFPAEYVLSETLLINKSITLEGFGINSIIKLGDGTPVVGQSHTIKVTANNVKIRNLSIINANPGGFVNGTTALRVEGDNCLIEQCYLKALNWGIQLYGVLAPIVRNCHIDSSNSFLCSHNTIPCREALIQGNYLTYNDVATGHCFSPIDAGGFAKLRYINNVSRMTIIAGNEPDGALRNPMMYFFNGNQSLNIFEHNNLELTAMRNVPEAIAFGIVGGKADDEPVSGALVGHNTFIYRFMAGSGTDDINGISWDGAPNKKITFYDNRIEYFHSAGVKMKAVRYLLMGTTMFTPFWSAPNTQVIIEDGGLRGIGCTASVPPVIEGVGEVIYKTKGKQWIDNISLLNAGNSKSLFSEIGLNIKVPARPILKIKGTASGAGGILKATLRKSGINTNFIATTPASIGIEEVSATEVISADEYISTHQYEVGDYVISEGYIIKCISRPPVGLSIEDSYNGGYWELLETEPLTYSIADIMEGDDIDILVEASVTDFTDIQVILELQELE